MISSVSAYKIYLVFLAQGTIVLLRDNLNFSPLAGCLTVDLTASSRWLTGASPAGREWAGASRLNSRQLCNSGALARRRAPVGVHAVLGGLIQFPSCPARCATTQGRSLFPRDINNDVMVSGRVRIGPVAFLCLDPKPGLRK